MRLRYLVLFTLAFTVSLCLYSQYSYTNYVGYKQLLVCPNPPNGNAAIFQVAWGSSGAHLKLEKSGNSCYVTITEYFEGTEEVSCDYYWYWYDNYGYQHTNNATARYSFRCNPVTVTPSPSSMTLAVGEGKQLNYSYSPGNVSPKPKIVLQSQNTNIVSVTQDGWVKAVGSGTTSIRLANNAGPDAYCQVTVEKNTPTEVSLPQSAQVYVGESVTLEPTVEPSGTSTTFTWYSTNSLIARVSSSGSVTGVEEGEADVYAISANGLRTNNCNITVSYRKPSSVSISPSSLNLPLSHQKTLKANVYPSNAKYTLTWSVTPPSDVVSVSSTGEVTALKVGEAVVKVQTDNGYSATCNVTVPPEPDSISLPKKIALTWGKSRRLTATVAPYNAYKSLTWRSSDNYVVQVSSDGTLNACSPGEADITVRTQNGKEASCHVEVCAPLFVFNVWMRSSDALQFNLTEKPKISLSNGMLILDTKNQSIELDTAEVYKFTIENKTVDRMPERIEMLGELELLYKQTHQLSPVLYPTDYDIATSLTWTSSNSEVASVSTKGVVTALSPGLADIQVAASNGCHAVCHVIVPEPSYNLFIWLKDGRYDTYAFRDKPKVTYADGNLVVDSQWGSYQYAHEQVWKLTVLDSDTPLTTMLPSQPSPLPLKGQLSRQGDILSMNGLEPYSELFIYSSDGRLYGVYKATAEGELQINLADELPAGAYLLKTDKITFKIIKK